MRYVLTEDHILVGEENTVFYGIAAIVLENGVPTILDCISGITTQPEQLQILIQKCNDSMLSQIHLREVIEDFLS